MLSVWTSVRSLWLANDGDRKKTGSFPSDVDNDDDGGGAAGIENKTQMPIRMRIRTGWRWGHVRPGELAK